MLTLIPPGPDGPATFATRRPPAFAGPSAPPIISDVLPWPHRIRRLGLSRPPADETSRLIVGSTGSGKSAGELIDLVRLARRGDHAVVLLDGHGPLAFSAVGHWAAGAVKLIR